MVFSFVMNAVPAILWWYKVGAFETGQCGRVIWKCARELAEVAVVPEETGVELSLNETFSSSECWC